MKKILKTGDITNELQGASLFFAKPATPPSAEPAPAETKPEPITESPGLAQVPSEKAQTDTTTRLEEHKKEETNSDTMTPRYRDTTTPRYHASKQPSIHGVTIELIRKAVKEFGKEAATHRFTGTEKKEIADLIYTYKNTGIRTSENEVTRIAVNFIIEDYKENGETSVLHKILEALNE